VTATAALLFSVRHRGFQRAPEHSAALKSREALLAHLKKMMGWAARVGALAHDARRFDEYWRSHIQGLIDAYASEGGEDAPPR